MAITSAKSPCSGHSICHQAITSAFTLVAKVKCMWFNIFHKLAITSAMAITSAINSIQAITSAYIQLNIPWQLHQPRWAITSAQGYNISLQLTTTSVNLVITSASTGIYICLFLITTYSGFNIYHYWQ